MLEVSKERKIDLGYRGVSWGSYKTYPKTNYFYFWRHVDGSRLI